MANFIGNMKNKKIMASTWFCKFPIDFERSRYVLLDYLQHVEKDFAQDNISKYLFDVRFHCKNLESFLNTRQCLESIIPLNKEQQLQFKEMIALPDTDSRYIEIMDIVKWGIPHLQKSLKTGSAIWKKVEGSLNVFYIGTTHILENNTGFIILRYGGSPIVEAYKFEYKPKTKDIAFHLIGYREAGAKADYGDVCESILKENNEKDAVIIGVESLHAYKTKDSVLPVLRHVLTTKVFNKSVMGLLGFGLDNP